MNGKAAPNKSRKEQLMTEKLHVVRNQKDTVFRMLFREKKELLELYNALNDSAYNSPEKLTIYTLENAIYMNFKNDSSFLLDSEMNLYEHQATYNPNMPLRDLVYIARQLEKYTRNDTIYSSALVKILVPRFVVFYNGTDVQPDRQTLRGLPVLFLFVYFFCFSGILCSDTPRGIRWPGRKGAHHERYCQFQLHRLRSVRQHLSGGL